MEFTVSERFEQKLMGIFCPVLLVTIFSVVILVGFFHPLAIEYKNVIMGVLVAELLSFLAFTSLRIIFGGENDYY